MKSFVTSLLVGSAVATPFGGSFFEKRQGGNTGIAALVGGVLNSEF